MTSSGREFLMWSASGGSKDGRVRTVQSRTVTSGLPSVQEASQPSSHPDDNFIFLTLIRDRVRKKQTVFVSCFVDNRRESTSEHSRGREKSAEESVTRAQHKTMQRAQSRAVLSPTVMRPTRRVPAMLVFTTGMSADSSF